MLIAPTSTRERVSHVRLASSAVLAVSGGADSMVMATLLLEQSPVSVSAIATFDHGTGDAARLAVEEVAAWGALRGIPVRVGRGTALRRTESAWRQARWEFLRGVATEFGVPVATAHTRDDQAETVFMRLLRGSGVRGLAGLLAPGPVLRPLVTLSRADVRAYAAETRVTFQEDPSNADLRYLRNRIRLELLPALEAVEPGFREWLLDVGTRAAAWREELVKAVDDCWAPSVRDQGSVWVPRSASRLPTAEEAALFWPEVAGRIGVALDRRGTARLASFTTKQSTALQMPLSGGALVRSARDGWTLERAGVGT